jgi:topoisomerase IV subunit A
VLPHNFNELIEAQVAILHGEPFDVVPDFPQGGLMDAAGYDRGRGAVRVRARIEVRDPATLVVRELPFGATTDTLIASIEDAARKGKLKLRGISDFTAERVEIEITLQAEQDAARAAEALYAFTQCEVQVASRIVVIRDRKPVEMDVHDVLRHNTARLVELLRRHLKLRQKQLTEELHRKTLVQLFVANRLYRPIEACSSPEEVEAAVRAGLEPFRPALQRDLTHGDVELLLGIPIRRISQFDLARNAEEMDKIRADLAEAGRDLAGLVPYAVRYLRNLQRKHAAAFPRRTEIATFEAVAVRELTASELQIRYDRAKGYLGHGVPGDPLLECSSLDRLLLVWRDGRYKVVPPPAKLFVDKTLIHAAILDRDRTLTVVYADTFFTRVKRFPAGGTVTNREYRCIPKGCEILVLADDDPAVLYVRYAEGENQAIRQQTFDLRKLPVRDRGAPGAVVSAKRLHDIRAARPADWDDALTGPPGVLTAPG